MPINATQAHWIQGLFKCFVFKTTTLAPLNTVLFKQFVLQYVCLCNRRSLISIRKLLPVSVSEIERRVGWIIVFNATFNNISVISWRSVLLVEETGLPGENLPQVTDKLYHIIFIWGIKDLPRNQICQKTKWFIYL